MSKETPANPVKGSNKGQGRNNRNQSFRSDKDTPPYNDVYDKEHDVVIPGISDEQKVAEGYVAPLQFQLQQIKVKTTGTDGETRERVIRTIGRFQKDNFDRKELKRVHTGRKGPSGKSASMSNRHNVTKSTLIVHLKNFRRKIDFNDFKADPLNFKPQGFKTTYSFKDVRENEIYQVLSTIIRLDRGKKDDNVLNYIMKYYFNGKAYEGNA